VGAGHGRQVKELDVFGDLFNSIWDALSQYVPADSWLSDFLSQFLTMLSDFFDTFFGSMQP
jgi:hypothetical protein